MAYCALCGSEFIPDKNHPYQKFCCVKHRKEFGHKKERGFNGTRTIKEKENRQQIPCKVCGDLFTPTKSNLAYCCQTCRDEGERRVEREEKWIQIIKSRERSRKKVRHCAFCGRSFNPAVTRRWKYCSTRHYFLDVYGREAPEAKVKQCEWCGKEFVSRISRARACPEHANLLAKWERNQRVRAVLHIPYSRWEIFKRDQFMCHICGAPIDMQSSAPEPLSPSIDHVIPVVLGGADAEFNVKAAHFICNSTKSDKVL